MIRIAGSRSPRFITIAQARDQRECAAFLVAACAGDEAPRREVESLLAQPASADGFFDELAVALAAQLMRDTGARRC